MLKKLKRSNNLKEEGAKGSLQKKKKKKSVTNVTPASDPKLENWLSIWVPPQFSPKNKFVLNHSKWPKTHFGQFFFFFFSVTFSRSDPPPQVTNVTLFFFEDFPKFHVYDSVSK